MASYTNSCITPPSVNMGGISGERETERVRKRPRPSVHLINFMTFCINLRKCPEMAILNRPLWVPFHFSYDRPIIIWTLEIREWGQSCVLASLVGWDGLPQGVRSQILHPQIEVSPAQTNRHFLPLNGAFFFFL